MIGFLVSEETKDMLKGMVLQAQLDKGLSPFLHISAIEHEGEWFIPFDDHALETRVYGGIMLQELPEFGEIIEHIGGLESRVDVELKQEDPPTD